MEVYHLLFYKVVILVFIMKVEFVFLILNQYHVDELIHE